jgi:hypothetical protein
MDEELDATLFRADMTLEVNKKYDQSIPGRNICTTLFELSMTDADTIFIAHPAFWGHVPYKKLGFGCPRKGYSTIWKASGGENIEVFRSPGFLQQKAHRRIIYMAETYTELRQAKIVTDCVKLNIVVCRPMNSRR